ncbi:hypothetical protein Tco_1167221 [Tanacetum coccineum]
MEITVVTLVEEQMSSWKAYKEVMEVLERCGSDGDVVGKADSIASLGVKHLKHIPLFSVASNPDVSQHELWGSLNSELLLNQKVEGDGEVRVITRGFGDLVAKLGDKVVMEVLVRCLSDGDVVVRSW